MNKGNKAASRKYVLTPLLGMCTIGILCVAELTPAALFGATSTNDHLVPVVQYLGLAPLYRKLWQQKLFVTPGEIARYVQLPGSAGKEVAVSVYKRRKREGGLPGDYWATATQPAVPLSDCVAAAGVDKQLDPKTVEVRRWDAPLPKSTALVIQKLWLAMLSATGPEPEPDVIAVDSSTEIFFATDTRGRVLEAQAPVSPKGDALALVKVGNLLIDYCSAPAPQRPKLAEEIEKEALNLLNRVSKH
jgi:hypothetical protein